MARNEERNVKRTMNGTEVGGKKEEERGKMYRRKEKGSREVRRMRKEGRGRRREE